MQNMVIDGARNSNHGSVVDAYSHREEENKSELSEREVYRQVKNGPQKKESRDSLSSYQNSNNSSD